MVKEVVCSIIHSELRHQKPLGWLIDNRVWAKWRGKHVVKSSTYEA